MGSMGYQKRGKLRPTAVYPGRVAIDDVHTALRRGFYSHVRPLLAGGKAVDARDADGQTALMICSQLSSERWAVTIARLLLEQGASVGIRDPHGLNALHYACLYEQQELVRVYLAAVDYNLNEQDEAGNTPLHYCVLRNNSDLLR